MHRRRFLVGATRTAATFGALRYLGSCRDAGPVAKSTSTPPGGSFASLRDRYFVRALQLYPVTSTYLGGDGYSSALDATNGKLRDWGPEALKSEAAFYREIERARQALDPARLESADRIDHAVLGAQIGFVLRQLEERRQHERAVDTYVAEPFRGVDWQLQQMEPGSNGQLGSEAEWALVVERLQAVPPYLETARANLLRGKQDGNVADRRLVQYDGIAGCKADDEYFRSTLPKLTAGYLGRRPFAPAMLDRVARAAAAAADAFRDFAGFLEQTYDPSDRTDRYEVGEAEYYWRVRHCLHVDRSAAELWKYGAE